MWTFLKIYKNYLTIDSQLVLNKICRSTPNKTSQNFKLFYERKDKCYCYDC